MPRSLYRSVRHALVFTTSILFTACGGGGSGGDPVTPPTVASVSVSPPNANIEVGQSTTLSATPKDASGTTVSGRTITWSSSANTIATVANGVVTAISPGTATISANTDGRTGSATITVTPIPVASVVLSTHSSSVVVAGTVTLSAQTLSAGGTSLSGRAIMWTSVTPAVATVADGVVTAVTVGTSRIIASAEGHADTAIVTVTPVPVATVTLTASSTSLLVGTTATLTATTRDAAGAVLTGRTIAFTSSSTAVATIVGNTVTAVAPGTTTITATSESRTATVQITVTAVPVASVSVSPTSAIVQVAGTTTLAATPRDSTGAALAGRTTTWASSASTIATVANGVVTGVSPGSATITATSEGRSGSAIISVAAPTIVFTKSTELQIGTIDTVIRFNNNAIASDGRAISANGTRVYERASNGVWNTTGVVIAGTPAVISTVVDPNGGFWVTGSNGVIMRRLSSGWVAENTTTNSTAFQSLSVNADTTAFAVGNPANTIYRRSSVGVWTTTNIANSTILQHVGSANASFAVAVGAGATQGTGVAFQFNGATWSPIVFPVANFRPTDVLVVSANEAYMVGATGIDALSDTRFTILQWNGATWTVVIQKATEIYAGATNLTRCADGTVYAGAIWGTIYRKQGATFSALPGAAPYNYSATLTCDSDNSLVASDYASDRALLRYNGTWTLQRWQPNMDYVSIGANGQTFVSSTRSVGRLASGTWERTLISYPNQSPAFFTRAVFASGTQAVLGGAPPGLFNGTWQWGAFSPTRGRLGLWGPSSNQIFGVGSTNQIDVFNGASWSSVALGFTGFVTLDRIRGRGNFALATANGTTNAAQWNGSAWSLFTNPPQFGWGPYEVFSSTSIINLVNNTLTQWNGTTWTPLPGGTVPGSITNMLALAPNDIYLFRTNDIAHYDGHSVISTQSLETPILSVATDGTKVVAVGSGGYMMRATLPPIVWANRRR